MSPIRVVLAEDQAIVRAGFRSLLEAEPGIEVVGEAASGGDAVQQVRSLAPDVVIMDIRMPGMDGLEATGLITADEELSHTRVLILTTFELDEYVFGALRAGASGFLLKGGDLSDLVHAIGVVASGESLLAPSVTRRLIQTFVSQSKSQPRSAPDGWDELTVREREVLGLVAAGLTNGEIAEALYISPLTAKTHLSRIRMKLGARDRVQLVVMAYESGLA